MAMNLFQISAGFLDRKDSYFLPCFTIWQWTKRHLSYTLQLMCPCKYIPFLQKVQSREADVTHFLCEDIKHHLFPWWFGQTLMLWQFLWQFCLTLWEFLTWEKLPESIIIFYFHSEVSAILFPVKTLHSQGHYSGNTWMDGFLLLTRFCSIYFFQSFAVCMAWDSHAVNFQIPRIRKYGRFLQF